MKIPILRLRNTLQASIQPDLTDQELSDFRANLVEKVVETEAAGVVIDVTTLDVVDSYMARVINEMAHMVRLLGSEVVVCGMQPSVALTLVEMGRQLVGVEAALDLDQGVEKLERLIAARDEPSATRASEEA